MNPQRRPASAAALLEEASQWRVLSLLLSRPIPARKREVRELAAELTEPDLAAAARAWCDNAAEGPYLHLLGPGGLVPARAVAYRPFADPGWVLADVSRTHRAFGFHPAAEEPPDHVAVLTDFVAYLLLKEAYARDRGDEDAAEVTGAARTRFIGEHLAPVAGAMAARLDACGATDWSAAVRLLAARVPAPPAAVRAPAGGDEPLQCGGCAAAASLVEDDREPKEQPQ
jgi:Nitrate reductase delta subunit